MNISTWIGWSSSKLQDVSFMHYCDFLSVAKVSILKSINGNPFREKFGDHLEALDDPRDDLVLKPWILSPQPISFLPSSQDNLFFFFFFERASEWPSRGGGQSGEGQRDRERQSQAGYTLSTEPDVGQDLTTLRSWPEPKSRVRHLTRWEPSRCP